MLRVTVELCPHGDDGERRPIAHAVIGRLPGSVETAEGHVYAAGLWEDRAPEEMRAAAVTHQHADGIWPLVSAVITRCGEEAGAGLTPEVLDLVRERLGGALPPDVILAPRRSESCADTRLTEPTGWGPRRRGDDEGLT